jgi:short-subunit dehydrogenase
VQVAVVTGASSGIGAAIARRLTADGWQCILLARREDALRDLAAEIGGEVEACDVSDREAVDRVAERIRERHPAIGLLVNNAGVAARGDFFAAEPERIEEVVRTNYLGNVWCLRAFLPALEAATPSHVVNIVSVAGTVALGTSGPYAASKHAQLAFSRSAAVQLRPRGVHVHTVNPGFVETPGFPQRGRSRNRIWQRIVIEPDDVARRVVEVIASGKVETTVPGWYRAGSVAQALAPGLLVRLLGRRRRG